MVFSFDLAKSHTDLPYSTFWQYVTELTATGDRTLQLKLNPDQINPDKARQILEQELGATKGSDGIYVLPDGTRLGPYKAQTPYGWTDWMTAIDLVSQSAKAAGIDVNSEFPDQPVVNSKIRNGDFDLTLWFVAGATPASPWQRFRDVLDDRGVPEFGQQAFWNYGRFKHPDVPALLDRAAAATDLVIGSHPHVLQPAELLVAAGRSGYVAFSLGSFIFDQEWSSATSTGALLRVLLDGAGVAVAAAAPIEIVGGPIYFTK